jgi:hypothetical protein
VGRLVQREPLPPDSGHDPAEYTSRRLHAPSTDGTQVGPRESEDELQTRLAQKAEGFTCPAPGQLNRNGAVAARFTPAADALPAAMVRL